MKQLSLVFIIFLLMTQYGFSQDKDLIHADTTVLIDPINTDTLTTPAEPLGGYRLLWKFLQYRVNEGDSLGKLYPFYLHNIKFRVNAKGQVDLALIMINHLRHPIQYKIAEELKKTKWLPAKERGIPVSSYHELHYGRGIMSFNKRVYKKYKSYHSDL